MFTEGLGANSLRWVRKESGFKPNSVPNHGSEAGVVYNLKKGGGGLAVPPPAKFLNEHLSTGVTPASRVRLVSRNGNESGSDMDLSSDSEVEISGDNGANFQRGIRTINGTFPRNVRMTSQQDFCGRLQNKKHFDDRIPTAPPFVGSDPEVRTDHIDVNSSVISLPSRLPTFHASQKGSWHALIAYESCVRLCLHSWAQDHCMEAPYFLNDECCLLRDAFGLRKVLLQPEEELLAKQSSEIVSLKAAPFIRKTNCKMKVQVRKVNMGLDSPTSCSSFICKATKS
ncbi:Pesticidal crystal cry8Ba protein [Quillaja saponaria]|uniref:Pesticidal crystal cry8Ba protein n=1 Tax=Quillaja saponaria TaxID=32244 RepID=A0AAD7KQB2_QUISA|nr:Pesticidal crystal cry8Ba protein [Quillaja saponaria]